MILKPDVQAKFLKETTPGELVRFRYGNTMPLGVVIGHESQDTTTGLAVLLLEDLVGRQGFIGTALKVHERMAEQMALSYGRDLEIVVDPLAAVLPGSDPLFNGLGLLILTKDVRAIRTAVEDRMWGPQSVLVDVATWKSVSGSTFPNSDERLAITEWEIRSSSQQVGIHPPKPIYKFKMKADNG